MKKVILLLIISTLIVISGCDQNKQEEAKKQIPVMIYEVQPDNIASYLKITGSLKAATDLDLYSMSTEKVKKIHVKEGDRVKKGDLLVEQENELSSQGVNLALAGLSSARAQLDLVNKEFIRMEKLYTANAITKQQFEQVEMQKSSAEAGLDLAEAQLAQAQEQLKHSKIYAPASGKIAMLHFKEGQMVAAGTPVVKMVNTRNMTATLSASEIDMQKLYIGQAVKANFPALGEKEYSGRIISIDSAIDPVSRSLEVEVEIANNSNELCSGMFGEFMLITDEHSAVAVLSDEAVLTRTRLRIDQNGRQITEKEYYVFLNENGKAVTRSVETGIHSQGRLEITSGLSMGEKVIVVGQNIVKDGDQVKVVN